MKSWKPFKTVINIQESTSDNYSAMIRDFRYIDAFLLDIIGEG